MGCGEEVRGEDGQHLESALQGQKQGMGVEQQRGVHPPATTTITTTITTTPFELHLHMIAMDGPPAQGGGGFPQHPPHQLLLPSEGHFHTTPTPTTLPLCAPTLHMGVAGRQHIRAQLPQALMGEDFEAEKALEGLVLCPSTPHPHIGEGGVGGLLAVVHSAGAGGKGGGGWGWELGTIEFHWVFTRLYYHGITTMALLPRAGMGGWPEG